ncbi:MAG: glycosyltransferase, partial [Acidimicrobiales bacterium]
MVLTYNSPDNLVRALQAIGAQTRLPDALLVVDNASDPPASQVVDAWTPPDGIDVHVLSQVENTGPAGGWARALEYFRSSLHDVGWLLDDDIIPPPDCLDVLLEDAGDPDCAFLIPAVRQPTGATTTYPAW